MPFHLVWVSLALVYGFRVWSLVGTVLIGLGTAAASGLALSWAIAEGHVHSDEYAEIPLMAVLFFAMVWHARRRQAALEQTVRLLEERRHLIERDREFLRDASHQLRTPITIARGHTELLLEQVSGRARKDAEVVLDELVRLGNVAERLLVLQAAERPEFLMLDRVSPGDVLTQAVARWAEVADRRWQTADASTGDLVADPERLATAVDALVENAVSFTRPGEAIRLSAADHGPGITLAVEDQGPGIPPELYQRVFERFWTRDGQRRAGRGTGLGLAIVAAISSAHGGLTVVGVAPDLGGAQVAMRLPRRPPSPNQDTDGHAIRPDPLG